MRRTYSGHPACCAVGLRNVELIESRTWSSARPSWGGRLLAGLEGLRDLPNVGRRARARHDVRHRAGGEEGDAAPAIGARSARRKEALSRGLIFRLRGGAPIPAIGDTICIAPPLSTPDGDDPSDSRHPPRLDRLRRRNSGPEHAPSPLPSPASR